MFNKHQRFPTLSCYAAAHDQIILLHIHFFCKYQGFPTLSCYESLMQQFKPHNCTFINTKFSQLCLVMGLEIDHYLVIYAEVVFIFTYAPTVANS